MKSHLFRYRWIWAMAAAVFLAGLGLSWRIVGNPDIGFQLNGARYLLDHGDVPRSEPFLYMVPWSRYVDLQWLWQLSIYGANQWGGLLGMNLLSVGFTFLASVILLIRCRKLAGGLGAVSFAFLVLLFTFNGWDYRPHTISWLYLGLVLLCLEKYSAGDDRSIWYLPPIMVGWVNCHALFSLGLLTIGLWIIGELIEAFRHREGDSGQVWRRWYRLFGVGALSGLVCLLNPYGWEGLIFPFRQFTLMTSSHIAKDLIFGIREFEPLWNQGLVFSLNGMPVLPLWHLMSWAIFGGVISGLLIRRPRWPWAVWIIGIAFTFLFLTAVKNWSYFSFALIPYASAGWSQQLHEWREKWGKVGRIVILILCGALLLLMRVDWLSRMTSNMGYGLSFDPVAHPEGVVEIIRRAGPSVRIMNPHDLGGWLAWATGRQVYIDGRNDNYPERLYKEFIPSLILPEHFQILLEATRANVVVARVGRENVWIETLAKEPDWRLVYRSPGVVTFFRKDLAPEISAVQEDKKIEESLPANSVIWDQLLHDAAEKPLPGWVNTLPLHLLEPDDSSGNSASSICLGNGRQGQAYAWAGIEKSPYFLTELWVNLAIAFEMAKDYPKADFCWDTILQKVPSRDLQEQSEKARLRRSLPDPRIQLQFEEMRRRGLR